MQLGRLSFPSQAAHWLAVAAALLVYILSTRMRRQRRPATSAVAWVFGMIALPYIVLPAYLMFGVRKLTRVRTLGLRAPAGTHWAERLLASFAMPPASPAKIGLHRNGQEALASLRAVILRAQETLDIATFILAEDELGSEVMRLLRERAQSGVRVRLLLDGVGLILSSSHRSLKALRASGVELQVFRPPWARVVDGPRNLRNHRKLTIADGALLWAGGRNLAAEYFTGTPDEPAWHDLSFDLEGPIAADAALQFEADWLASGGRPGALLPRHYVSEPDGRVQFVPSGPDQMEDTVHALLLDSAYRAERTITAVTPYFLPDEALETALRLAARRGVSVRIFLPAKSNHFLTDFARSRSLRSLAAAGVEVRLTPFMNHAKVVVVDDSLALSGSPNLDLRSLLLNHESAFVFYDRAQIRWLATWIEGLDVDAHAFDAREPSLLRDFAEGLVLTVAFQL